MTPVDATTSCAGSTPAAAAARRWSSAASASPCGPFATFAFLGLVVFLTLIYFANIFGPPPPSVMTIAIAGIAGAALFTVWAWWADRHRG